MTRRHKMWILLAVVAVLLALPWLFNGSYNRWGATDAELAKTLPGDELNPAPISDFTHAITIDAPPEKVWPWVAQIGMERGGWYTYDWFYDLTKSGGFVDGHSAERIIPELQTLKVGDVIKMNAGVPFQVVDLQPAHAMVLKVDSPGAPSWVWYLEPLPGGGTRVLERFRQGGQPSFAAKLLQVYLLDSGGRVFSVKHLKGLKERAERR